jgi:5-methylthioribose kinase
MSMTSAPAILLDPADPEALERYLRERGWLHRDERLLGVSPAGEGNMNLTLRVTTSTRSVIVKQGRPWVQKYPSIPAPAERTLVEAQWYATAGSVASLAARLPRLIAVDADARVLLMSDLGHAPDLLDLYGGGRLSGDQLDSLVDWLLELHGTFAGDARAARLENRAMRTLNHEHMFEVPLKDDDGLDLDAITPGLTELAAELRREPSLVEAVDALGRRYLDSGTTLLHGDFYPGSWLRAPEPWVIDPEFGFYGPPEFDLGVMLAHLELAGRAPELTERTVVRYLSASAIDLPLAWGFAGIEVIRRLLGVAQLPLSLDLAAKRELINRGRARILATA